MSEAISPSNNSTSTLHNENLDRTAMNESTLVEKTLAETSNHESIATATDTSATMSNPDAQSMGTTSWNNHEDDTGEFVEPGVKSGIFGTSANLVNTIVGAGIIGIPYAIKNSGLVAGVLMLILVAYLTDKSLRVLIEAAKFHPKLHNRDITSFEELMSYPFGKFGSIFVLFNMFVMAYGAMVAYLLIIKDTVPTILGFAHGVDGGLEREIILILTSLTIMVPLSMQKDMASLACTSLLSVTADIILVGFVVMFSPVQESVQEIGGVGELLKRDSIKPTLFIGLGILSTAMACQQTSFIVYGSLTNGTRKRWTAVTNSSIFTAASLCVILGVTGYLGFLEDTQGDVLNNYEADGVVANGARTLLAITMLFTYPMEVFVARHVLISLFYSGVSTTPSDSNNCCNRVRRMALWLYISSLIPALIFDDLGPVLSITGAIGGSCISYITPGIVYLGVNGDAFLLQCKEMLADWGRRKRVEIEDDGDIELPVAGNAGRMIQDESRNQDVANAGSLPSDGKRIEMVLSPDQPKPFWWYMLGYPIWCWIATKGNEGMNRKLLVPVVYDETEEQNRSRNNGNESVNNDEVLFPTKGEFRIAIFFIIFGTIAGIAGLGSNIYVQVNDLY